MNNSKRCKILLKSLVRVYEEYEGIRSFIDKSLKKISPGLFLCFDFFAVIFVIIHGYCVLLSQTKN